MRTQNRVLVLLAPGQHKVATKIGVVALVVALCCAAPAAGAGNTPTVTQLGRAFHPGEITIAAGETLTVSNRDDFIHQIYVKSDLMNFDSDEQPPGQMIHVTSPTTGTFKVRCHIHPKMSLIVHVR